MFNIGDEAPAWKLADQQGEKRSLKEFRGKWAILYFYPEDDTPGCTTEACGFRDVSEKLTGLNAVVLGISPDSTGSHDKFARKFSLPFTLLADPTKDTLRAYGAWGKKLAYGKEYEGVIRSTFLIDPEGIVRKSYSPVKADGHAAQVLKDLRVLSKR